MPTASMTVQGGCETLYLVFAVEQQQVCKGDRREGRLLQQEGQLLKTLWWFCVHVQQSLVVESHWIQLLNAHFLIRGISIEHTKIEVMFFISRDFKNPAGGASHTRLKHCRLNGRDQTGLNITPRKCKPLYSKKTCYHYLHVSLHTNIPTLIFY